jgi:Fe-Mn family superoxide dismutase
VNGEIVAKELDARLLTLDGISEKQIREHYSLYEGYVKKLNEVREKLADSGFDKAGPNQTYSALRALKLGETFAAGGVILHETYFGNLGGKGTEPGKKTKAFLEERFGSFENFKEIITNCGMAVRGWVILAYENLSKSLRVIGADAHDVGAIWDAKPILAMDVYEHAYFLDFGTKRADYIEAFWKNVDWNEIERRLSSLNK